MSMAISFLARKAMVFMLVFFMIFSGLIYLPENPVVMNASAETNPIFNIGCKQLDKEVGNELSILFN